MDIQACDWGLEVLALWQTWVADTLLLVQGCSPSHTSATPNDRNRTPAADCPIVRSATQMALCVEYANAGDLYRRLQRFS